VILAGAIVPTAPLLVAPGSGGLPEAVAGIADATRLTLRTLPDHDVAVLVAGAAEPAVHVRADASLAGIGRADLAADLPVDQAAAGAVAAATRLPLIRGRPLPLGHAVLVHLYRAAGRLAPVVPVAVAATAGADGLVATGAAIEAGLRDRSAVVVVAGDLSAGSTERAPLALVEGAKAWDDQAVDAVAGGRLERLTRLGPAEALRVGALGWAPLVVLHGICRGARLGTVVRRYAAPRGVGYLVAGAG
jgi:hypothetical protein